LKILGFIARLKRIVVIIYKNQLISIIKTHAMHLNEELSLILRLALATFIGFSIGLERQRNGRIAGIRTFATMALGTALFTLLSIHFSPEGFNTTIIAAIIIAVGFISSKMLVLENNQYDFSNIVALWVTAAISMCTAFGMYTIAGATGFLLLLIYLLKDVFEPKQ
jgi:putative Mg2+ transporter-C (MgtC) family protein